MSDIELRWFDDDGVSSRDLDELSELRQRTNGFCWLDIGAWSPEAERLLAEEFAFHPMAVRDRRERHHVPRVHVCVDHLFTATPRAAHHPHQGCAGRRDLPPSDRLVEFAPQESMHLMRDLLNQYERVVRISQSQLEFLMV
ncbi:MAG TPA: hypothetical protein VIT65_28785 [Microlunatus sp.]